MNKPIQPNQSAVNDDVHLNPYNQPLSSVQPIDEPGSELLYVINLEDDSGREFYITQGNTLVSLAEPIHQELILVETYEELTSRLSQLRQKYPPSCRIYALERSEFDYRRRQVQSALANKLLKE